MKRNYIGRNSLLIAILGVISIEYLLYTDYLKNDYWRILSYGFEAATIGGFADWFAVKALFKEIPIPFIRNHTNIIVKNRTKLSNGISDLVSNKWLSISIIKEKIESIPFVTSLIKALNKPENKDKVIVFLKKGIQLATTNIDNPETSKKLQKLLKNKINSIDISIPLSEWLIKLIEKKEHDKLWHLLLDTSEKTIDNNATKTLLLQVVDEKIKGYKKETLSKGIMVKLGKFTGAINNETIVNKILYAVHDLINDARSNENHPLREKFDQKTIEFINNLKEGKGESFKIITDLKDQFLNTENVNAIIQPVLNNLKTTISDQLEDKNTPIYKVLKENFDKLLLKLESDENLQSKIHTSIIDTINPIVEKYHHEIGNLVSNSLSKLSDNELVDQIESKVGNDLQFIRLNGAIVGGCIGLIIALVRVKFLHT